MPKSAKGAATAKTQVKDLAPKGENVKGGDKIQGSVGKRLADKRNDIQRNLS